MKWKPAGSKQGLEIWEMTTSHIEHARNWMKSQLSNYPQRLIDKFQNRKRKWRINNRIFNYYYHLLLIAQFDRELKFREIYPDYKTLLVPVRSNPHDRVAKLILADWLAERGLRPVMERKLRRYATN